MNSMLTVFGWHNVQPTWCFPNRRSGTRGLVKQLHALKRLANPVDLNSGLAALAAGEKLPPRAVALCWDDGYRDNLEVAVPILEELELPSSFFLVPALLDGKSMAWWETVGWAFERTTMDSIVWQGRRFETSRSQRRSSYNQASDVLLSLTHAERTAAVEELVDLLAPEGTSGVESMFMDWDGARELVARGFDVGSHTMRHVNLANESDEDQFEDLRDSRTTLEGALGVPISTVAYPHGQPNAVSSVTRDSASMAGYRFALTTRAGCNRPGTPATEIRRIMLDPATGLFVTGAMKIKNRLVRR